MCGKEYLVRSTKNGGSRFYDFGVELNGFGKQANDFAKVLSELTGINTINNLTLISLNGVFPVKGVLRRNKAWCPICLENWKNNKEHIYEPLIWDIKPVKICGVHKVNLKTKCPQCKREIPVLSRKSRNGFCSFCGCWLGSNDINLNENLTQEKLSWEYFIQTSIKSLIKMENELNVNPSDKNIFNFLKLLIDEVGGIGAFSSYFDIPISTVRLWYKEAHKPLLYTLLKICFRMGINITDIFTSEKICVNFIPTSKKLYHVVDNKYINKTLKINWITIENTLKEIINCNLDTPYSVCEIARNIGCNKRSLYKHFPDLCKMISKKYTLYIQMMKNKRIEEGCKKISEATIILYNSGVYPSRRKVEELLPPGLLLRERAFQVAWKEVLKSLNLL